MVFIVQLNCLLPFWIFLVQHLECHKSVYDWSIHRSSGDACLKFLSPCMSEAFIPTVSKWRWSEPYWFPLIFIYVEHSHSWKILLSILCSDLFIILDTNILIILRCSGFLSRKGGLKKLINKCEHSESVIVREYQYSLWRVQGTYIQKQ